MADLLSVFRCFVWCFDRSLSMRMTGLNLLPGGPGWKGSALVFQVSLAVLSRVSLDEISPLSLTRRTVDSSTSQGSSLASRNFSLSSHPPPPNQPTQAFTSDPSSPSQYSAPSVPLAATHRPPPPSSSSPKRMKGMIFRKRQRRPPRRRASP